MLQSTSRCFSSRVLRQQYKIFAHRQLSVKMCSTNSPVLPKSVGAKEAFEILKSDKRVKYLDVRTLEEIEATGSTPGARIVPIFEGPSMQPNQSFIHQVKSLIPDESTPIVVGCRSGRRSQTAIQVLQHVGYIDLANLEAGFEGWRAEGLPSEPAGPDAFATSASSDLKL